MYVTIDGFESLTAQQVFDISAKHLLKQNEKSRKFGSMYGSCLYRGPDNRQCAAGPFLKDECASDCEQRSWRGLVLDGRVPDSHQELIRILQDVHDAYPVESWETNLRQVAAGYDLVFPEIS
jgi:hypothetical protein